MQSHCNWNPYSSVNHVPLQTKGNLNIIKKSGPTSKPACCITVTSYSGT